MLSAMYCITMTEISEEEQPTVAASTYETIAGLTKSDEPVAGNSNINSHNHNNREKKKKKRPRRNPCQRRRGRGRGRGGLNIYYYN